MRYLLTILLILAICQCKAQVANIKTCKDKGLVYFPNLSTSSLTIEGGCVTQKQADTLFKIFAKNLCGETSSAFYDISGKDGALAYSSTNAWNDSTGCSTKKTWMKMVKSKWVNISKQEYERLKK